MPLHNIPAELRALPQWVTATGEPNEKGEPDKAPRNPRTGNLADPMDSKTWGTYEQAIQSGSRFIGFVFSERDPYAFIDLDDPQDGLQAARHSQILSAISSYTELSQSGRGVHIVVRGRVPHGVRRDKVEVYSSGRYGIFTGNTLNQFPIANGQALLDTLFAEMATTAGTAALAEAGELLTDEALWDMGSNAVNGDKFEQLWRGDWERDYPSQSEADMALMSMLCYYSLSNEQCRRVFRMSKLGERDKAGRTQYLNYMIAKCRAKEPPRVDLSQLKTDAGSNGHKPEPYAKNETKPVPAGSNGQHGPGDNRSGPPNPPGNRPRPAMVTKPDATPYPPGLVGELAEYFYSSAIRPVREVALVTALAYVAGVIGRSYNVSATGLNQYIILLAKTGSGKESIARGIDSLVAALRSVVPMADRFIGPAAFASGQALVRVLDERPCFVSVLGEFGVTLKQLCDPRASTPTTMLKKVFLDLYTKSGFSQVLRPSVYSDSDKNTKLIQAPCVTLLGESTPDEFYGGLDAGVVLGGLLPRFTVVEYDGPRPGRNRNAFHPPSEELINKVVELLTVGLTTEQNKTCCAVPIDSEAQAILDALDEHATRQINASGEVDRHLWNRAHLKALKLSALLAVGCNAQAPLVGKIHAEWARAFVVRDVELMSRKFATGDVGEGQSKQENDLKTAIREYATLSKASLVNYKIPAKLLPETHIIPYHYLRRRLRLVSSFKNDRLGASAAIEALLADMVESEALVRIDRRTATEAFGVSQTLYSKGATF